MVVEIWWFPIIEDVEVCGGGLWSMLSLCCMDDDEFHCPGDWGVSVVVVLKLRS